MTRGIEEVKVGVAGLRPGMYVSRLDRPWLQTSFPLQGIKIESESDIARIRAVCAYVYVDVARGPRPSARHWICESETVTRVAVEKREFAALARQSYGSSRTVTEELKEAKTVQKKVSMCFESAMRNLKRDRKLEVDELSVEIRGMVDSIIRNPAALLLISQIRKADSYSYKHALGTAVWSACFGRNLGLERQDIELLALGGLLLDIGKIKLSPDLLSKDTSLTEAEAHLVRSHVAHSASILRATEGISPRIIQMVLTHHEREDGSGYPKGLAGSAIPIFGRIGGIVDSYDAMISNRPYHSGRSPHEAMTELYEQRGRLFQSELVEQFIQTTGVFPTGSLVELSNAEVGVVVELNDLRRLFPKVMIILDADKSPRNEFKIVDLAALERDNPSGSVHIAKGLPPNAYGIDPKQIFL